MDRPRIRDVHNAASLQGMLTARVEACGIRLSAHTDFDQLAHEYLEGTGRAVYPVFDPTLSDICTQSGFVVRGEDDNGRVVHLQAFRLWNLQGSNLAEHFRRHIRLYCAADEARIDTRNTVVTGANSNGISGKVAYHGQIWLDKEYRGRDVMGMPLGREVLPRIGIILAYLAMRPDFVFGLSAYPTAEKGMTSSYGFYHNDMAALTFRDSQRNTLWHETVSYLTASDIGNEVKRTLERCAMERRALPSPPTVLRTKPGLAAAVSVQ